MSQTEEQSLSSTISTLQPKMSMDSILASQQSLNHSIPLKTYHINNTATNNDSNLVFPARNTSQSQESTTQCTMNLHRNITPELDNIFEMEERGIWPFTRQQSNGSIQACISHGSTGEISDVSTALVSADEISFDMQQIQCQSFSKFPIERNQNNHSMRRPAQIIRSKRASSSKHITHNKPNLHISTNLPIPNNNDMYTYIHTNSSPPMSTESIPNKPAPIITRKKFKKRKRSRIDRMAMNEPWAWSDCRGASYWDSIMQWDMEQDKDNKNHGHDGKSNDNLSIDTDFTIPPQMSSGTIFGSINEDDLEEELMI